jgi:3-oxoacyl-[acyl-carrier protein] reductase
VAETTLDDWDTAYKTVLRWKVDIAKTFAPAMAAAGYGRLLFIESSAVKQPLENLVLSNSIRLASVGFAKTYAQEIAASGVTINIMAPGSHNTPAIERLYKKKNEQTGQPLETIRHQAAQQIPVSALGDAADFASLAAWLLSPHSKYITGQTISVDGGVVKSTFG